MHPRLFLALVLSTLTTQAASAEETQTTVLLQSWATVWDQDENPQADPAGYGDPEHDPGVSLQRARLGLQGKTDQLSYAVVVGASAPYDALVEGSTSVQIVDAVVGWHLDKDAFDLGISIGQQKVPVGREMLIGAHQLLFQERSIHSAWLLPGREAGLIVDAELDSGLRARLGAFNGNGSVWGDNNPGLLGSARLEYAKGDTYQTYSTKDESAFGFGLSAFYNSDLATRELGLGTDVLLRFSGFNLLLDVAQTTLQPADSTLAVPEVMAKTARLGGGVQLSMNLPLSQGTLEPGLRLAYYDDNMDFEDNGDVATLHAGLTWHDAAPGLDLGAGFVHREELQGATAANDTLRLWVQFSNKERNQP